MGQWQAEADKFLVHAKGRVVAIMTVTDLDRHKARLATALVVIVSVRLWDSPVYAARLGVLATKPKRKKSKKASAGDGGGGGAASAAAAAAHDAIGDLAKAVDKIKNSDLYNPARGGDPQARPLAVLEGYRWHRLAIDEAHELVASEAPLGAVPVYLLEAEHRWCLTATAPVSSAEDVHGLGLLLGVDLGCGAGVSAAFVREFIRSSKTDLGDLPPPVEHTTEVTLSPEERTLVEVKARELKAPIENGSLAAVEEVGMGRAIAPHPLTHSPTRSLSHSLTSSICSTHSHARSLTHSHNTHTPR